MTPTKTVKQYGETAVSTYKTLNLAVIGAGDLAVERAKTVVAQFRSKAEALPGEAQVQADLAVKEARTRATDAAGTARITAQQFATAVRPEVLRSTVESLLETARTQAVATVEKLAEHGAEVVEELRHQPGFRRVVRRTERAVDTVEGTLEGVIGGTAKKSTPAARTSSSAKSTSTPVSRARTAKPANPTAVPAKKS